MERDLASGRRRPSKVATALSIPEEGEKGEKEGEKEGVSIQYTARSTKHTPQYAAYHPWMTASHKVSNIYTPQKTY